MGGLAFTRTPDACGKGEVRKGIILGGALGVALTMWYFLAITKAPSCGLTSVSVNDDIDINLEGFDWGNEKFFGKSYMNKRMNTLKYYKTVLRLAQQYAPDAQSVIDVGAPWPFVTAFDWIPRKVMLNNRYPEGFTTPDDVTAIMADFYEYEPEHQFDLVLCNQVMEHVPDPASFAKKLLSIGKVVVASVPYMWHEGTPGHVQHEIDMETFLSWFGRPDYTELGIIQEQHQCGAHCRRLFVVFRPTIPKSRKLSIDNKEQDP